MTTTIHATQWAVVWLAAIGWTATWLLSRPTSRWRHLLGGIVATLLWIPVAYTSNNVGVASAGSTLTFGSDAIAGVATFMVVVTLAGTLIGLYLWVEETTDDAENALPREMQHRRGDG